VSDIRQKIVKALTKTPLTAREIAEDYKLKVQSVSATLQQMALSNFVQRGDFAEGEGQIWEVTELGIETYGTKADLEVIVVDKKDVKQVVEMLVATDEPVVEESLLTEIEVIVAENLCGCEITECETPENLEEIELTEEEIEAFEMPPTMPPKHSMTPESFQIWQIVDEAGAKMIELLKAKQAKPIDNIDYKIATLESLADIYNPKISATLREIAADLRA